jgi:hypothetical protein
MAIFALIGSAAMNAVTSSGNIIIRNAWAVMDDSCRGGQEGGCGAGAGGLDDFDQCDSAETDAQYDACSASGDPGHTGNGCNAYDWSKCTVNPHLHTPHPYCTQPIHQKEKRCHVHDAPASPASTGAPTRTSSNSTTKQSAPQYPHYPPSPVPVNCGINPKEYPCKAPCEYPCPSSVSSGASLFDLIFGTNGQSGGLGAWLRDVIQASLGHAFQQHGLALGRIAADNNLPQHCQDQVQCHSSVVQTSTNPGSSFLDVISGLTGTVPSNIDVNRDMGGAAGALLDNLNLGAGLTDGYATTNVKENLANAAVGDLRSAIDYNGNSPLSQLVKSEPILPHASYALDNMIAAKVLQVDDNNNNLQKQLPESQIECFAAPCTTPGQPQPTGGGPLLQQPSQQCAPLLCGSVLSDANDNKLPLSTLQQQQQSNLRTQLTGQVGGEFNQQLPQLQKLPNQDSIKQQVQQQLQERQMPIPPTQQQAGQILGQSGQSLPPIR